MTGKPTTQVDGQVAQHVLEQAAGWVARLQSRDATDEDRRDFQNWLAHDPVHRSAYDELRQLWGDLQDVPLVSRPGPSRTRRLVVGQLLGLTVVAGLTVLAGGAGLIDRIRADHYTAIGEVRSLVLDDGTRVDLNTDSAIAIRYSAAERRVQLLRGEAFFNVAKNPDRPFVVTEGGWRATALGTRYAVRTPSGAHDGEVSVEEGRVEVFGEGEGIVLAAGDSASLTHGLPLAARPVDVATETAWRFGKLVFSGRPLREVLATLGRYRRGTILVLDERAASQTVSGIFDLRDTDQALDALEGSLPVSVHRLSDMVVVVRSR